MAPSKTKVALLGACVLVGCRDGTGPSEIGLDWSGTIAVGDALEIKGVNGSITATPASVAVATVTATKTGHDDLAGVTIEVVTHAGGVTICAVYPDVPGQPPNECAPGTGGHLGVSDNDVEVEFTVTVPAGVVFLGTTVNGDVRATNLRSDAFATTVNGDATVSTTQLATATVVNGTITVAIGLADPPQDLSFTAVNGNVTVEVPAATNAEADLSTTTGAVVSDFPLTTVSATHFRGTLGSGGQDLVLQTVNGNVRLKRGS